MYSDKSDKENDQEHDESDNEVMGKSEDSDTDTSERQDDSYIEPEPIEPLKETTYTEQSHEELGEVEEVCDFQRFGFSNSKEIKYIISLTYCLFSQKNILYLLYFRSCIHMKYIRIYKQLKPCNTQI